MDTLIIPNLLPLKNNADSETVGQTLDLKNFKVITGSEDSARGWRRLNIRQDNKGRSESLSFFDLWGLIARLDDALRELQANLRIPLIGHKI